MSRGKKGGFLRKWGGKGVCFVEDNQRVGRGVCEGIGGGRRRQVR